MVLEENMDRLVGSICMVGCTASAMQLVNGAIWWWRRGTQEEKPKLGRWKGKNPCMAQSNFHMVSESVGIQNL